jgi:hypothetical protein
MLVPIFPSFKFVAQDSLIRKFLTIKRTISTKRFSDSNSRYSRPKSNNQYSDRKPNARFIDRNEGLRSAEKFGGSHMKSDFYYRNKDYDGNEEEVKTDNFDGDNIYGISPVRLAIGAGRRNITELIIQSGMDLSNKKDEKNANEILKIAKETGVKIRELSKHDMNMLTDNRPHQGFVLRADPLEYVAITQLEPSSTYKFYFIF